MQRISQTMMSNMFLSDMHSSLKRLMDVEKQMASGQLYSKSSDNPAEVARGMAVGTSISRNEQYQKNLDDAVTWLSNTDTALGKITDLISSIREKVIYAGDGGLSEIDRNAIAEDINAMRDELIQSANFNVEGRYLLGGYQTSETPFVKSDDGEVCYLGDDNRISFEVEEGTVGSVSINGRDVFPQSFERRSVTSIEVPIGFKWEGSSEILQISVGDGTAQVEIPQRWTDSDSDNIADSSDYDGFVSPDEEVRGYSLSEIAELINSDESAGSLVHASVSTDSLSGTETIEIQSLSGEPLQVSSLPWTGSQDNGQYVNSNKVASGWSAASDGKITIDMGGDAAYEIGITAGESLADVVDSISGIEGIWAGVRDDGSIAVVAGDAEDAFSVTATGSGNNLFGANSTSRSLSVDSDISHIGLSSYLGLATGVSSTEVTPGSNLGDTTADNLDMVLQSGDHKLELNINDDADLTLQELADRIKGSAGDWLQVIVQDDSGCTDVTDSSGVNSENATARLMLIPKDGNALTIYDRDNSWAKSLGIQTALPSSDLSSATFPNTPAGDDTPAKINVEIGGESHEVKIYRADVVDPSTGYIDPEALAKRICAQIDTDDLGYDLTGGGTGFVLYSTAGETVKVTDLAYSDPSLDGLTSGLAVAAGLQSGVISDSVPQSQTTTASGSFVISTGGREVQVSVTNGEDLSDIASKIKNMAGSWLDVSLSSDTSSGEYRLALSAKDGSTLNVYDVNGTAVRDFGMNTDVRLDKGTWAGGGSVSLSVDGYTDVIDLSDIPATGDLQDVADIINARYGGGDIAAKVDDSGGELIFYSPAGKDITISGVPAGMMSVGSTSTPYRGSGTDVGPYNQNAVVRSGADVEESDIFGLLDDLAVAVEQGADEALSNSFLPKLDTAIDDALSSRSYCGALQRRYTTANNRLSENNIAFTELYSSIMDVDVADAATEFQTAQTIYQATLATIAKVVQPSLVDYLS